MAYTILSIMDIVKLSDKQLQKVEKKLAVMIGKQSLDDPKDIPILCLTDTKEDDVIIHELESIPVSMKEQNVLTAEHLLVYIKSVKLYKTNKDFQFIFHSILESHNKDNEDENDYTILDTLSDLLF